mgnify:CR=1 FL=1
MVGATIPIVLDKFGIDPAMATGVFITSTNDVLGVLVFFLMVNSSSDVQVLNQNNTIKLPDSTAQQPPGDVLALTVTDRDILVNGRLVVKRDAFQTFDGQVEPALKQELDYQASRSSAPAPDAGRPITILADRELPYELLKKIM